MAESTIWWVLAGVVVGAELLTMTFYLLMIALGLAAAAVAAHAGMGLNAQMVTAALVGGGAVLFWHWRQSGLPRAPKATENKDVNMDIGATVTVAEWQADGSANVNYRGANWQAHLAAGQALGQVGNYRVAEVVGSRLILVAA